MEFLSFQSLHDEMLYVCESSVSCWLKSRYDHSHFNYSLTIWNCFVLNAQVENSPSDYVLYVMHDTGFMELLSETDFPLVARLKLGPSEVWEWEYS